jgi:REP element-mobilizing transposase RayT
MARPLRLEFAGAIYHVFARGNRREAIYLSNDDRQCFTELLGSVCDRFNWVVHAWCLMGNHYHLVVETPDGNLARGMRQLNGVYTQQFNRRHGRDGHVFQGRYNAILVQRGQYLLELTRYVVLNPVRAGMVDAAGDWPWSAYQAQVGSVPAPWWLDTDWLLGQFGDRVGRAIRAYEGFVAAGVGADNPFDEVRDRLYLGDDSYGEALARLGGSDRPLRDVSKAQRRPLAGSLAEYARRWPDRRQAMARAYRSGAYTMREIADHFGVHYMTVSRAVHRVEQELDCGT